MSRLVVAIGHVEFTLANQTLYVVNVQQDADEWEVRRTYSDFRKLRDDVLRVMSRQHDPSSLEFARAVGATPFPPKRLFGSRKDRVVKERAVELHHFLIKLLLLTHTYRKAQKAQLSENEPEQASASVFFLLRDFLKPLGATPANAANSASATANDEHDETSHRVIRESKMLAMRSSSGNTTATNMIRSAHDSPPPPPNPPPVHVPAVKTPAQMLRQESSIPILEEVPPPQRKKTLSIGALTHHVGRSVSSASSQQQQNDDRSRQDSNASNTSYYSTSSSRKPSNAASEPDAAAHGGSSYTAASSVPVAISSSSSSSSSSASTVLSSSASSVPSRSKSSYNGSQSRSYTDENRTFSSSAIEGRRAKSKHASSSSSHARSKPRSISTKELRTSERKSKLSPQLTAQAISIQAQKELEQYVSEYSAIMILRYVDRFISKAVMKTPGPYTVQNERLVIDSERFYEELDDMFKDLPANFESNFKNVVGEWRFPLALDAYVQMKWNSFQECRSTPNSSTTNTSSTSYRSSASKKSSRRHHRKAGSDSDSESSSEYEYVGGGGGYMKPKKVFTDEEADVLDKMIAEGTAGKDQMLRLRRQMNEQGWNRRENPSGVGHFSSSFTKKKKGGISTNEYWTDTDDDDHRQTGSSGGEEAAIEHYQQKYNALRKERLSRREGGLV
uniref:PX domain-containing protein n=1 Tax=Globisporangium ultimum (strain ATCC 200006 / CBS 805.95 / DAOM BR144) TaxID=431595 RepID=K3WUZ7_GLOUD